jgi:hypothetical protein
VAFSDVDPLEEDMGVRCEDMNPDQLVSYIKSYQEAFNLNLRIDGLPERSVFKAMQRVYGADAGLIVKWVFYKYKGRYDNEPIRHLSFAKGRKWWVDKMHLEMQEELRRESSRTSEHAGLGTVSLLDL